MITVSCPANYKTRDKSECSRQTGFSLLERPCLRRQSSPSSFHNLPTSTAISPIAYLFRREYSLLPLNPVHNVQERSTAIWPIRGRRVCQRQTRLGEDNSPVNFLPSVAPTASLSSRIYHQWLRYSREKD